MKKRDKDEGYRWLEQASADLHGANVLLITKYTIWFASFPSKLLKRL